MRHEVRVGVAIQPVVHGALRFARRLEKANIVCIFADSGWKYYGTQVWDAAHAGAPDEEAEEIIWW